MCFTTGSFQETRGDVPAPCQNVPARRNDAVGSVSSGAQRDSTLDVAGLILPRLEAVRYRKERSLRTFKRGSPAGGRGRVDRAIAPAGGRPLRRAGPRLSRN